MINKRLKDVLFTDQWSEVCMERLSPFGYVLVSNGFSINTHMLALMFKMLDSMHTHYVIADEISVSCHCFSSFCSLSNGWSDNL